MMMMMMMFRGQNDQLITLLSPDMKNSQLVNLASSFAGDV
jgi:hypothetical protein